MSAWFLTFLVHLATTMCEECDNALFQTQRLLMQPPKVAVYAQIGTENSAIWEDLYMCISNVAKSHQVDVFVSTVIGHEEAESYYQNLSHVDGVSKVVLQELENRGADVGQFLQQILATDIGSYQAVLKIHTKSKRKWRQYMIENLCGTPDAAKAAIEFFQRNAEVGIIGPSTLTKFGRDVTYRYGDSFCRILECYPGFPKHRPIFELIDLDSLNWCWKVMTNSTDLPPGDLWTIIAGDMFWIRGACLSQPRLLRAIPTLLSNMTFGYEKNSFGKPEHAMERWIPTLVRVDGWMVADMALDADKALGADMALGAGTTNVQFNRY